MKKKFLVLMVIFSMLMAYAGVGSAAAAPSGAGTVLELVSAQAGMSGTVFIFKVSGEFSGAELKGLVRMEDGREFTIDGLRWSWSAMRVSDTPRLSRSSTSNSREG